MRRLAPLVALALALPGCAHPAAAPGGSAPPAAALGQLRLTQCEGAESILVGPASLFAVPKPPGWDAPSAWSEVRLDAYVCQRVSLDSFERGPLHLLFETEADDAAVPAACRAGGPPWQLTALWVDDPTVAAHLARAYGLPAIAGEMAVAGEPVGAAGQTWSWHRPGEPASSLSFAADTGDAHADAGDQRLFWFNATTLHALDEHATRATANVQGAAAGTLRPPMLYPARAGTEAYAGEGLLFHRADAIAALRSFHDFGCASPAEVQR